MTSILKELPSADVGKLDLTYEVAEAILRGLAGALDSPTSAQFVEEIPPLPKVPDAVEQQPAETKLRLAEARYRTLVEQLPIVTFLAALDGGVNELYVSPQIEALLGFTQKEWLDDPVLWFTQLHPEDRGRWQLEFARTCAANVSRSLRPPTQ